LIHCILYEYQTIILPDKENTESSEEKVKRRRLPWENTEYRQQYLINFANKMGFDPSIKENWKGMGPKIDLHQVNSKLYYQR